MGSSIGIIYAVGTMSNDIGMRDSPTLMKIRVNPVRFLVDALYVHRIMHVSAGMTTNTEPGATKMTTATTTTRLQKTIASLIEHSDAIGMDLATMPGWKQGTARALDRQRDLDATNYRLTMLGVTTTTTK